MTAKSVASLGSSQTRPLEENIVKLSTRNQLPGTVVAITRGAAMAVVKVKLDGGEQIITSSITRDAVDDLQLAEGTAVTVLVKSTDVSLGVE